MTKELITAHERRKKRMHQAVCNMYREMVEDPNNQGAAPTRVMRAVGHKMGLTTKGVYGIVIKYGLYVQQPKK